VDRYAMQMASVENLLLHAGDQEQSGAGFRGPNLER
jgi:hypothetical protein